MAVERSPSGSSLIDVLDRVLDKGIVIDAWVRVSLVGITGPVSRPREVTAGAEGELERVQQENAELKRRLEKLNG